MQELRSRYLGLRSWWRSIGSASSLPSCVVQEAAVGLAWHQRNLYLADFMNTLSRRVFLLPELAGIEGMEYDQCISLSSWWLLFLISIDSN